MPDKSERGGKPVGRIRTVDLKPLSSSPMDQNAGRMRQMLHAAYDDVLTEPLSPRLQALVDGLQCARGCARR